MDRTNLALWLATHRPDTPEGVAHIEAVRALLAEVDRPFSRHTFAPGHVTASAFVLSPAGDELLLILHRFLGRWLQPGGHIEPEDDDIVAAACREVVEETGVRSLSLEPGSPWLIDVDVHDIPAREAKGELAHRHYDVRVLLHATEGALRDTEEVDAVRWVPLKEVAALDTDDSVRRVARVLQARRVGAQPLESPAAARNVTAIEAVVKPLVAPGGTVVEFASGTGQHAAWLAPRLKVGRWIPTDLQDEALASIAAVTEGVEEIARPRRVDLCGDPTTPLAGIRADLVYAANIAHISPTHATRGLFRGAAELLDPGGWLVLYGPFAMGGALTPDSNVRFDRSLRDRNPGWGIRDLEDVVQRAAACGLSWERTVPMPANNHCLVFRRVDPSTGLSDPRPGELLRAWFGGNPDDPPSVVRRAWFASDPAWDRSMDEAFGPLVDEALDGGFSRWEATPRGCLALILLLDQLTRQRFRGEGRAFEGDPRARALTERLAADGGLAVLSSFERHFALMPWMHAESLPLQDLSVAAFRDLAAEHPAMAGGISFALDHRDTIVRFGRFPYRNKALERQSTDEETRWLKARSG